MVEYPIKERYDFDDLCEIVKVLRSKDGCPWDRVQTHTSVRRDFIEETYEAIEGIDSGDPEILREELGDVLLQVVFHANIADGEGEFTIDDVLTDICKKLIIRHPHVFTAKAEYAGVETPEEVLKNWNEIKMQTKGQKTLNDSLEGITKAMPALMRAQKIASKMRKADKPVKTELDDLKELTERYFNEPTNEDLGRLLFAVTAYADEKGIDAEEALYFENENFISKVK